MFYDFILFLFSYGLTSILFDIPIPQPIKLLYLCISGSYYHSLCLLSFFNSVYSFRSRWQFLMWHPVIDVLYFLSIFWPTVFIVSFFSEIGMSLLLDLRVCPECLRVKRRTREQRPLSFLFIKDEFSVRSNIRYSPSFVKSRPPLRNFFTTLTFFSITIVLSLRSPMSPLTIFKITHPLSLFSLPLPTHSTPFSIDTLVHEIWKLH